MADLKISQLTALTAAAAASTDVLPVVDTSATTTKKMSLADISEFVAGQTVITNLVPTDSDEIIEGSTNLYHTTARVTAQSQNDQFVLSAAIFTS